MWMLRRCRRSDEAEVEDDDVAYGDFGEATPPAPAQPLPLTAK